MTKIDFHSNIADKLNYVCRLVRKARHAECQIIIFDTNQAFLSELDRELWTFSKTDFLPHVYANDPLANQSPIILQYNEKAELPHQDILINLHHETPAFFNVFKRVFEIVSSEEQDVLAGRQKYRHYQHLGISPQHTVAKIS